MVLEGIIKFFADSFTNAFSFWLLVILLSFFLFLVLKVLDVPKMYTGVAAVILTIIGLELTLVEIFKLLGNPITFGTYTFNIPFYGEIVSRSMVMLWNFLDFVFNFGLFREIGVPYLEAATKTITVLPDPSFLFKAFVWGYVFIDSIVEYLFFVVVFYAIIILLSDWINYDTSSAKIYAGFAAAVPVLFYSLYISNPFKEYAQALPELQKVLFFIENGSTTAQVIVFGTLLVSFLVVMQILAAFTMLFYETSANTLRPDMQASMWAVNTQGMGFLFTLSFAIMYALHQHAWYIFFPAVILYSLFKKCAAGAGEVVKAHEEKKEMRNFIKDAIKEGKR